MDINLIVLEYEKFLNGYLRELVLLRIESENLKKEIATRQDEIKQLKNQVDELHKQINLLKNKDE